VSYVLIIDDDLDHCEIVSRVLSRGGHTTRCVPGHREAMKSLVAETPDLIILDVLMPGMDGVTLLEVIRSYLRWVFVPVVIATAYPEDERLAEIAPLGVTRVFAKAKSDMAELLDYVNQHARPAAALAAPEHAQSTLRL
jgi:two-component system alkaline phosphatase synthesis response regulator PhoP